MFAVIFDTLFHDYIAVVVTCQTFVAQPQSEVIPLLVDVIQLPLLICDGVSLSISMTVPKVWIIQSAIVIQTLAVEFE